MRALLPLLILPLILGAVPESRADSIADSIFGTVIGRYGSLPKLDCDTHSLDGSDRPAETILAQASKALSDEDFCTAAQRYYELDLQHPDRAREVQASLRAIQALAEGGFLYTLQAEISGYRVLHPRDPKNEYLERLLIDGYLKMLPTDRCTNPVSSRKDQHGTPIPLIEAGEAEVEFALQVYAPKGDRGWYLAARDMIRAARARRDACQAEFYSMQGRMHDKWNFWHAAYMRWDRIVCDPTENAVLPEALYNLVTSIQALTRLRPDDPGVPPDWAARAHRASDELIKSYPDSEWAKKLVHGE